MRISAALRVSAVLLTERCRDRRDTQRKLRHHQPLHKLVRHGTIRHDRDLPPLTAEHWDRERSTSWRCCNEKQSHYGRSPRASNANSISACPLVHVICSRRSEERRVGKECRSRW